MVETIGEARDLGWKLTARCVKGKLDNRTHTRECHGLLKLDMDTLVWTRGRDFPLARLAERLRCARCGSRNVAVYFEPPANKGVQRVR